MFHEGGGNGAKVSLSTSDTEPISSKVSDDISETENTFFFLRQNVTISLGRKACNGARKLTNKYAHKHENIKAKTDATRESMKF